MIPFAPFSTVMAPREFSPPYNHFYALSFVVNEPQMHKIDNIADYYVNQLLISRNADATFYIP